MTLALWIGAAELLVLIGVLAVLSALASPGLIRPRWERTLILLVWALIIVGMIIANIHFLKLLPHG